MRVKQALQRGFARILGHALRQVRNDDADARRVFGFPDLEESGLTRADLDRLLPEDHVHLAREAAHQVLRPLEHEVPPQVREANQSCGLGIQPPRARLLTATGTPTRVSIFRLSSVECCPRNERHDSALRFRNFNRS